MKGTKNLSLRINKFNVLFSLFIFSVHSGIVNELGWVARAGRSSKALIVIERTAVRAPVIKRGSCLNYGMSIGLMYAKRNYVRMN